MLIFIALYTLLTAIIVWMSYRLWQIFKKSTIHQPFKPKSPLPTVTVCIPARNEMHALSGCLERVLASDYEKLEIIVFDDSSADDTSILIKSFAHAGVRFIPGPVLPNGWLGKNHALEVMAEQASGSYVMFLEVDTFIKPTTISQLVGYVTEKKLDMISVVPGRYDAWRPSVLFGHLRYFWQLILSNSKHPAASSSLWMIKRSALTDKIKGFEAFKASVEPESQIAAFLGASSYQCLTNNDLIGVTYEKKWLSQVETSKRLLYPAFGHTPIKALLGFVLLLLLNAPLATILYGVIFDWTMIQVMASWLLLAFMAVYGAYAGRLWSRGWWLGGLLWPIVALQELFLFLCSVWGYATHTITWKGRLVNTSSSKGDAIVIK
jgi:glycosyltransferase involved in cell wall biosynthesis